MAELPEVGQSDRNAAQSGRSFERGRAQQSGTHRAPVYKPGALEPRLSSVTGLPGSGHLLFLVGKPKLQQEAGTCPGEHRFPPKTRGDALLSRTDTAALCNRSLWFMYTINKQSCERSLGSRRGAVRAAGPWTPVQRWEGRAEAPPNCGRGGPRKHTQVSYTPAHRTTSTQPPSRPRAAHP